MSKRMNWIALAALLLCLAGCRRTSEAQVKVTNKGTKQIHVNISGSIMLIGAGQTGTFDFSWDGRGAVVVTLVAYPVDDPNQYQSQVLELNHGEVLTVNIQITGG